MSKPLSPDYDAGPKVLDPNDLGLDLLASGVRASRVGEDGHVLLMGHHDDPTALSLFAEFCRYYDGDTLTKDDLAVYEVKRGYAAFSDHSEGCDLHDCTCDDRACKPCRDGNHDACDEPDHCECRGEYNHDFDGPWPCACECYCDEYAWWVAETKSGHEVTWVQWSWEKSKARRDRIEDSVTPPGDGEAS